MTKEEVIKEYRVREILEAARRVMARYGMQGTTVDRVAEEAKVAKGTIYLYFDTKDELVNAAVIEGLREMTAEVLASDDSSMPPLDRIRKLILAHFRMLASNQDFLKTLIIGNSLDIELESQPGREFMRVYAAHVDFVASVLQDAIDHGAIRRIDPQFAAFMLGEMLTGSLRRRLLKLASSPLESDAEAVVELFLKGIATIPCD
ncbi:TetR/AcrR family transcriptional regulator [Candidatus Binatus sp.]|uniref:TetR/AcrR family transcriptional regulator n=1 Tax=Candidatus Binatus sp. TaxID=2811406 RepID=UPI002FD96355